MARETSDITQRQTAVEDWDLKGFDDLMNQLSDYAKKADAKNLDKVLKTGAEAIVKDLKKLPMPISKIRRPGYTHLIDSFLYARSGRYRLQYEIGWGKFYGRMVEDGTERSKAQPHMGPAYERNKERYWQLMIEQFNK